MVVEEGDNDRWRRIPYDSDPSDDPIHYSASIADARHPETRVKELEGRELKRSFQVIRDHFPVFTFPIVHIEVTRGDPDFDRGGMDGPWQDVEAGIVTATLDFERGLDKLEGGEDRWEGVTQKAAMANVRSFLSEPKAIAAGAGDMSIVVDTFAKTLRATRDNFLSMSDKYNQDKANYPERRDLVEAYYAQYAREVLDQVYRPNAEAVGQNNPGFTTGADSKVDPTAALGPLQNGGTREVGGGAGRFEGGGGGGAPPFRGSPVGPPDFSGLTDLARGPSSVPDGLDALTPGPTTPTGPAGMDNAAKDALGQAANAANQAAASPKPPGGMPPEGVLGLGPKGLDTPVNKAGVGAKSGGGGGGAGLKGGAGLPRSMAPPASASSPLTAARGMAIPGVAGSAAGLGSGAGMPPPMAPPGAGQRGGGEEKDHKVLKALRRKQYGEAVVGDNEAIVPVVGESDEPQPANSGQT